MKIVIIQEAGRHEENKQFREALNLSRSLNRIDGVESKVWGLNYDTFSTPFSEIEKWADVIFILENYTSGWLPASEIMNSKKLKIFWSIDSHIVLGQHVYMCRDLKVDIHLNSTESYLPNFNFVDRRYWFPNCYPSDLIFPMIDIEKNVNVGYCGSIGGARTEWVDALLPLGIKKDIMVIGKSMVNAINSYKVHFNRNCSNDINYRTFETTGCGTMCLTNYTPGLEKLFNIGDELITYDSKDDLLDKARYYINNDSERIRIQTLGYYRVIKDHTYDVRAEELIKLIG